MGRPYAWKLGAPGYVREEWCPPQGFLWEAGHFLFLQNQPQVKEATKRILFERTNMKGSKTRAAPITEDEGRVLILAVLESCIRDYLYKDPILSNVDHKCSERFIFDDTYRIDWGTWTLSPRELLAEADLDIDFVRRKVRERGLPGIHRPRAHSSLL